MEAKPYCFPVEWVWVTKSAEFYLIFLALDFCLFRNIFDRSTPCDDFFESLRMLHGILSGDHTVFRYQVIVCLVVYYRRRWTSHNHFRMAREKRKLYLAEMSKKDWSAHHENLEEKFFLQRDKILLFESANYSQQIWIYNFSSSNCDTTKDDKHLKIISQWRLRHVIEKKKKRLFPCRNI